MMRTERIGAAVVLLLGIGYLLEAFFMEEVTIGDPLGPRVFPIILGALMVALGFSLQIRPVGSSASRLFTPAAAYALVLALLLFAYSLSIGTIGYPAATFLFLLVVSRLLGEKSWATSLGLPLALSLGIFGLFTRVLDIPLPLGFFAKLME
jgi:putative tricarboxylic transport membrane protein